jgi:hypothetical protein
MKLISRIPRDLAVSMGVFLLLFATAAYFNIPTPQSEEIGFGWEYGNIATALVRGKGFANPFGVESGPTAWMPPLFVFLMAGIFYLFGIKSISAIWAILFIKYIAIAACSYFLLAAIDQTRYRRYKYGLIFIFGILIFINLGAYFKTIHDDWLILFLSCSTVTAFTTRIHKPSRTNTICLCIVAFMLPFASPALTLSFTIVQIGGFLWPRAPWSSFKSRLLPGLVVLGFLAASTLLWTYRNYKVFGVFIPIKSNLWFDFYQANVLDTDGLVTSSTFLKYHPIEKNGSQEKYLAEKEVQFNREARDFSIAWIRTHPSSLLQNMGRRAVSAFIYEHNAEDIQRVKPGLLSPEDIEKLRQAKLISLYRAPAIYWISLSMPPNEIERQIHALKLSNELSILQDWSARRQTLIDWMNDPRRILRSFLESFIPIFCLICGLMAEKIRKNPLFIVTTTVYLTYLTPYILISYYRRYQVPLVGLHAIFIFLFICFLVEKFPLRGIPFLKPR